MNLKTLGLKKILLLIAALVLLISLIFIFTYQKKANPAKTFESYKAYLEKQDYKSIYSLLSTNSKSEVTEDNFIKRFQNIYNSIESTNITLKSETIENIKPDQSGKITIPFSIVMDTLAGNIEIKGYNLILTEEKIDKTPKWTVTWSEKLIFPDLESTDKVKVTVLTPKRGEIIDRNGKGLALNGNINTIGIIPSKFNSEKDKSIPIISQILDISQEKIKSLVKTSSNPDWFLPIVNISSDDKITSNKLTALDGVQYQNSRGRIYPGGEAFGSLIGYIGPITAEELSNNKDKGYTSQDKIGKAGLEQIYEERLKGKKGGEISILKGGKDNLKKVILKREATDGENIKVSIDFDTQNKIYDGIKKDAGASAAINPKNGEILALVSSPSYDSNLFSTYVPDAIRNAWNSKTKDPFINRFKKVYAPGSTFKLVTGAIGLKNGTLKPDEAVNITGTQWQPNKSWGNNTVTRVHDLGKPVNLLDAYIYSDNIYFAMAAINITKDTFVTESKNFGIGETLPIDFPILKSQLSNNGLDSEALLANTGYGQGEVQLSPLNLALIYSSLSNNGNIMIPILELKDNVTPTVWKEKAISPEFVATLTNALTQVVDNPSGTAYTTPPSKTKLLGKTGTAELKKDKNDTTAEENGWFVAMNVDNPRLVVSMLVEDVKTRGESHYVVPIVKKVFDDILK